MKIVFSSILMFLTLLAGFQQAIIIVHFEMNRAAIEEQFCINKNRPEIQCHGICHLKKQLNDSGDGDTVLENNQYRTADLFFFPVTSFVSDSMLSNTFDKNGFYREAIYIDPSIEIFLPPPDAGYIFQIFLHVSHSS